MSNNYFLIKQRSLLLQIGYNMGIIYSAPSGLSYLWNFGSLALLSLIIQIFTGVFLAMYYTAHVDLAFDSVEHIMRDIKLGWFIRYLHANGASMFFAVVYCHIFRGLYYGSYFFPRNKLWVSGVLILFIMIGTAFMGYVLPWGQMSFWAATVITNLASAIPIYGKSLVIWFWGAFSVDVPTLNRFFALHYLFPFVLSGLIALHLFFLHEARSSDPLGLSSNIYIDGIPFGSYYIIKDLYGFVYYFFILFVLVFYFPNFLGHSDNYILANPTVTPAHIVPEWYFLPFYAILRSITDKLQGVILMLFFFFVLILIPLILNNMRILSFIASSGVFRPFYQIFIKIFFISCIILGWIGGNPAITPYIEIGYFSMLVYFFSITYGMFFSIILEFYVFNFELFIVFEDPTGNPFAIVAEFSELDEYKYIAMQTLMSYYSEYGRIKLDE
jgi:quinol-cytochrome oxidoreductase complex cytochrome b subunit